MSPDSEYNMDLCARVRDYCHRKGIQLLYPPATELRMRLVEHKAGFQLPPLLRLLYSQVANGGRGLGFGTPGYLARDGLIGCAGGYEYCCGAAWGTPSSEKQTIEQMVSHSGWRLAPSVVKALREYYCYVECEARPDRFISLSDDACECGTNTGTIELDGWTGELYSVWPGDCLQDYYARLGDNDNASTAYGDTAIISYLAPSLAVWLEYWLAGKQHALEDSIPFRGPLTKEIVEGAVDSHGVPVKRKPYPDL
jgi:hypothetical protein